MNTGHSENGGTDEVGFGCLICQTKTSEDNTWQQLAIGHISENYNW
jgi:hypothetical protein